MATEIGDLTGVGPKTLSRLQSAGVDSLEDLADLEPSDLTDAGISERRANKLIEKAGESTITIQSAADRQAEYDALDTVSTGIPGLDAMLDGGFEEEALVAAYGGAGSGKTQLAFHVMPQAVEQTGQPAVYIETERNRFRPNRIEQLASDPSLVDDIYGIRGYSNDAETPDLDVQKNAYQKVRNAFDNVSILVVDSFTARFRMAEKYDGRSELGERAVEFKQHLKALEQTASTLSCPVLLTCQVTGNPDMYGPDETIYGSSLFAHMASYYLHLSKTTGDLRKVQLENHPELPERELNLNVTESDIVGLEP